LFAALHDLAKDSSGLVAMVGATPYKLFLKVPWVNKQFAISDFILNKR
jgi:hypothetical protein